MSFHVSGNQYCANRFMSRELKLADPRRYVTARPLIRDPFHSPFHFAENRGHVRINPVRNKENLPDDNDRIRRMSLTLEGRPGDSIYLFISQRRADTCRSNQIQTTTAMTLISDVK